MPARPPYGGGLFCGECAKHLGYLSGKRSIPLADFRAFKRETRSLMMALVRINDFEAWSCAGSGRSTKILGIPTVAVTGVYGGELGKLDWRVD